MAQMARDETRVLVAELRHGAKFQAADFDDEGWVSIETIQRKLFYTPKNVSDGIQGDKTGRLMVSADGKKIRARYGHSINVDLGYDPVTPPTLLYHGTSNAASEAIKAEGLKAMRRTHVCLSSEREEAIRVARRHDTNTPVILHIDTKIATSLGIKFFKAGAGTNGTFIVDYIPPPCIVQFEDATSPPTPPWPKDDPLMENHRLCQEHETSTLDEQTSPPHPFTAADVGRCDDSPDLPKTQQIKLTEDEEELLCDQEHRFPPDLTAPLNKYDHDLLERRRTTRFNATSGSHQDDFSDDRANQWETCFHGESEWTVDPPPQKNNTRTQANAHHNPRERDHFASPPPPAATTRTIQNTGRMFVTLENQPDDRAPAVQKDPWANAYTEDSVWTMKSVDRFEAIRRDRERLQGTPRRAFSAKNDRAKSSTAYVAPTALPRGSTGEIPEIQIEQEKLQQVKQRLIESLELSLRTAEGENARLRREITDIERKHATEMASVRQQNVYEHQRAEAFRRELQIAKGQYNDDAERRNRKRVARQQHNWAEKYGMHGTAPAPWKATPPM